MSRTLSAVAQEVRGELVGEDAEFGAVSIDSRELESGSLFVAIAGERFDGNDFLADAHSRGAAGAMVSRQASIPLPQVKVLDTRAAFGRVACAWRENFSIPVVAVTGSNGKTTVKELIASILGARRSICVTRGNLNNDLGVPLTLMELGEEHEALVIELGANHAGEIDYLSGLAQPTVGVITNANAAHLEGFGSVAGVAAAKGELLDHLPRAGAAVINADDEYCADWRARSRAEEVIAFGLGAAADCTVRGEIVPRQGGSRFTLQLPEGAELQVELPLAGRHNVMNSLAAAAATHALGASGEEIQSGLSQAHAVKGRLNLLSGRGGALIIDDSYNANPESARAALDYLRGCDGNRVFVLGDMAELGETAPALHREIGEYARDCCDALFAVGDLSRHAAAAYGERGRFFPELASLQQALEPLLAEDTTLLLKGSRVMELDRLAARLGTEHEVSEVSAC